MPLADTLEKAATPVTYTASGGALIFGFSANEFAALVATGIAVLTFFVNIWFKWQHLKAVKRAPRRNRALAFRFSRFNPAYPFGLVSRQGPRL